MGKRLIQHFKINIPADNDDYDNNDLKFRQEVEKVVGFALMSKRMDQVDLRGTFYLEINGKEVFPKETDAKLFTTNASVKVMDKFYIFKDSKGNDTPLDAGDQTLKIRYRSDNNALVAFAAHDVQFSFMLVSKSKSL